MPSLIASIPSPSSGAFDVGPLTIHMYGITLLVAILAATWMTYVRWRNVGGDPDGFAGQRDRVIQPLGLTAEEEEQLVRFLESLTGDPVDAGLGCDASFKPRRPYVLCDGGTP